MKTTKVSRIRDALKRCEQKANVAGHVVLNSDGVHVGTVRLSYPRDGAGKLQVLVADWTSKRPKDPKTGQADFDNWTPWQYGWANGGGYDKATAAMHGMHVGGCTIEDGGHNWYNQLRNAGMIVIQAV